MTDSPLSENQWLHERAFPTQHVLQFFSYDHLPAGPMRDLSALCSQLAHAMVAELPDSPELTVGLRKLLEAKDAFVRCALVASRS